MSADAEADFLEGSPDTNTDDADASQPTAGNKKKKREWKKVDTSGFYKEWLEDNPRPPANKGGPGKGGKGKGKDADGEGKDRGKGGKRGGYGNMDQNQRNEDDPKAAMQGSVGDAGGFGPGGHVPMDGDQSHGGKGPGGKGNRKGGKGRDGVNPGVKGKGGNGPNNFGQGGFIGLGGNHMGKGPGCGGGCGPKGAFKGGKGRGPQGDGMMMQDGQASPDGQDGNRGNPRAPGPVRPPGAGMKGGCPQVGVGGLPIVPPYQYGGAVAQFPGNFGQPGQGMQVPYGAVPAMPTTYAAMPFCVMSSGNMQPCAGGGFIMAQGMPNAPGTPGGQGGGGAFLVSPGIAGHGVPGPGMPGTPSGGNGPGAGGGPSTPSGGPPGALAMMVPPTSPLANRGAPGPPPELTAEARARLKDRVRTQIEYYFGQENLPKDIYLRRQMNQDGWVSIHLVAGFRRVQTMTHDHSLVHEAVTSSTSLEVSPDLKNVRIKDKWAEWLLPQGWTDPTTPMSPGGGPAKPVSGGGSPPNATSPARAPPAHS